MAISFILIGCLPLSFVGTSTEEVLASREIPPPQPVELKPTVAVEQHTEYMIGEKGPSGGYVFYDKGSYVDGWRYIEVAPEVTEEGWMKWGGGGIKIKGTFGDVGMGYENTALIVSLIGQNDSYPALVCDELEYNGFDDWFLPSVDELTLIYKNLVVTGIGDFTKDQYGYHSFWSSTVDSSGNNYIAFAYYLATHNGDIYSAGRDFPSPYVRAARRF